MTDVTVTQAWECFEDSSYYDMWCVRRVHDRTFGNGFHLVNGDEAAKLRDHLNAHPPASPTAELVEALAYMIRAYDYEMDGRTQDTFLMVPEGSKIFSVADARTALKAHIERTDQ